MARTLIAGHQGLSPHVVELLRISVDELLSTFTTSRLQKHVGGICDQVMMVRTCWQRSGCMSVDSFTLISQGLAFVLE